MVLSNIDRFEECSFSFVSCVWWVEGLTTKGPVDVPSSFFRGPKDSVSKCLFHPFLSLKPLQVPWGNRERGTFFEETVDIVHGGMDRVSCET